MQNGMLAEAIGVVAVGVGATVIMDVWALVQKRCFGVPSLDYRLVGRWISYFRQGRFVHEGIGKAAPVTGEMPLGWAVHYAVGILFAALLVAIWGGEWLRHPTLGPALIVGIGSIIAPFFVMQPGLGAGIAASRTPKPWVSRFRSLIAHSSFAAGLYLAALIVSQLVSSQGG